MPDAVPGAPIAALEVRVLDGPNLYFPRPSIKVTLDLPGPMAAEESVLTALGRAVTLPRMRVGAPGSLQRHRFLARLCASVTRQVGRASGVRLGVRGRTLNEPGAVVIAFPWRNRDRALALGEALAPLLVDLVSDPGAGPDRIEELGARLREIPKGPRPTVLRPRVPVASITGTNGKTTTTRLLAHIGMTAGLRTGWSSTDGVLVQGEWVERGDYSGPAGARAVLTAPGVELGILETARGGMLLRGMGVAANDVSVVTNVSADHLGTQGVDTLDQLAEVKAIVTTVTKPEGWVVLNGDDPRVRAMAATATGRPWIFSLDPDSPALREALVRGGRGITVLGGDVVVLRRQTDPERLVRVRDIPLTLAGLSEINVANALAATAAALGLGLPREAVIEGLRTFEPDVAHNPGRMNVFTLPVTETEARPAGDVTVVIDLAHNEAGLEALLDVATGLAAPGARVHLGLGGVGDRSDEILTGLGAVAGRRADRVLITHKQHYLRGRTVENLEARFTEGLASVGVVPAGSAPTELAGLEELVDGARPGDVVTLMCHAERAEVWAWLESQHAVADTPKALRRKVTLARGEYEHDERIAALRELLDPAARLAETEELLALDPADPRLLFEAALASAVADDAPAARDRYERSLGAGLADPYRRDALTGLALSPDPAGPGAGAEVTTPDPLADLETEHPESATAAVLRALRTRGSEGADAALAGLLAHVVEHVGPDDAPYRDELAALLWTAGAGQGAADPGGRSGD